MQTMSEGWLPGARVVESPNADERPEGTAIDLIVLHHISLPAGRFGGDAIERLFTNMLDAALWPELAPLRVSAHFLIRRDGEVVQFVDIRRRAWHAGVSEWRGRAACNDFSVGIELEGDAATPFEPAQYARLDPLLAWLHAQTGARALTTHSEIAAGRKIDPGPTFDFSRLAALPEGRHWQI
jgi:AmpD protein